MRAALVAPLQEMVALYNGCGGDCKTGCLERFCAADTEDANELFLLGRKLKEAVRGFKSTAGVRSPHEHRQRNVANDQKKVSIVKTLPSDERACSSIVARSSSNKSSVGGNLMEDLDEEVDGEGGAGGSLEEPQKKHKGRRLTRFDSQGTSVASRRNTRREFVFTNLPKLVEK
jgi:hypothetical protein